MTQPANRRRLAFELFVISFVSLYLELFFIRWLSGEIRFFTVFRTFPLVVCFVGLGMGCAIARERLFLWCPLSLLATVVLAKVFAVTGIRFQMFPSAGIYSWQDMASINLPNILFCAACVLTMLAGPFAAMTCIGAKLGALFNHFKPLSGYSINIAGAIAGSIVFAVVSFFGLHPWALLLPALIPISCYLPREKKGALNILVLSAALIINFLPVDQPPTVTHWSPYQQLTVVPLRDYYPREWSNVSAGPMWSTAEQAAKEAVISIINRCYVLLINLGPYQSAIDLSNRSMEQISASKPYADRFRMEWRRYQLPYKLKAPGDVLIVGSGTGNDVAAALRNGAGHVDAVELDPTIINIGKTQHPEHPYDDPRVTVICDDARHFFNQCTRQYDMVILGGLNSQTVVGQGSSVRVDTYVHTKESLERAMTLLRPDGLLLLSSFDTLDWLAQRVFTTIKAAAGYEPVVLYDNTSGMRSLWDTFVVGGAVKDGRLALPGEPYEVKRLSATERVVTDDWPYMYVAPVAFDAPYWFVMSVVLIIAMCAGVPLLFKKGSVSYWQMFFLGAAFLLLELKSIAQLSLLFGSTWLTTSIVVDVILLMVLPANYLIVKFPAVKLEALYGLLLVVLLGSFFAPSGFQRDGLPLPAQYAFITISSLLPLFAASLIFASSFRKVESPSRALAFNLFGAVVGGLLEYASNYTGIKSLSLIALVLYGLSFLPGKRPD